MVKISNMKIEVDFLTTTSVNEAIEEAIEKVFTFNVACITFVFNGVRISVNKDTDAEKTLKWYREQVKLLHKIKISTLKL